MGATATWCAALPVTHQREGAYQLPIDVLVASYEQIRWMPSIGFPPMPLTS